MHLCVHSQIVAVAVQALLWFYRHAAWKTCRKDRAARGLLLQACHYKEHTAFRTHTEQQHPCKCCNAWTKATPYHGRAFHCASHFHQVLKTQPPSARSFQRRI